MVVELTNKTYNKWYIVQEFCERDLQYLENNCQWGFLGGYTRGGIVDLEMGTLTVSIINGNGKPL
jgi:hypothetical protein